ncbi:MAG: SMC family ATPase [Anaerolineales bacterium]|nr:SMC family ATPase [Anaerolineales bacterium]NUQ84103.1 SMC family ATPase [Anaerolineales bacterium]
MIPIRLRISGFLSYRDPVELDFSPFDLACISGHNGAGKSSLLDAITWSLFGEARGKSSEVINLNADVKAAEVALTFEHEGNTYRVQRTLPRNKSTVLEFQIRSGDGWKPLTEKTTRETQARIEQTLRLDYETFVNASFFLQGKADQFTQQNASKRKDVLSNILGLEIWEEYKNRTAEKRKAIEREVGEIDGRVAEINAELAEEEARRRRLEELQMSLNQLSAAREAQESVLANIRRNAALLDEQRKLTSTLSKSLENARTALAGLETRLAAKQADRAAYADLVNRAKEIEARHKEWQNVRRELENWEKTASQFREHEKERAPLLEKIAAEKARLEEERRGLLVEEEEISNQSSVISELRAGIGEAEKALKDAEARVAERVELESKRNEARERQAELKAENENLKAQMDELKARIDRLKFAEGSECPLCGQPLSEEHRKSTLKQLEAEGKRKGDQYRANLEEAKSISKQVASYELQVTQLASAENERVKYAGEVSGLTERMEKLQAEAQKWESTGKKRLRQVEKTLESGKFAVEEQKQLARLDKELAKLGYDASAHDAARARENELRNVEEEYANLKSAKEAIKQIDGEIASLNSEIVNRKSEIENLEAEYQSAKGNLETAEAQAPNLDEAERELFRLRESENKVRAELGGAQQRVDILKTQRARKADFEKEREELQKQIARHKTLERAFGRDGVPALLIEQALPQIETKANEILDRLSDGQMSIRFVTQTEYKDKKRDDLKETLDIQISDTAGIRNYEMYSGGEAFRVNFAIRLALSEILAQRKGARLRTLVIDEGFGSQDTQGRQRLIEAINLVRGDFARIIVITHLDELKDAFPTRIEVEKGERGSTVRVI